MITKEEIETVIAAIEEASGENLRRYALESLSYYAEQHPEAANGLVFTNVDSFGGEGKGEHCHEVFRVTKKDSESVFIKFDGYYSSYDGTDYDNGFYFCESYIEPVTKWRKI